MKTFGILLISLLISLNLCAQNYEPILAVDTTSWFISHIIPDAGYTEKIVAHGDTVINDIKYKKAFLYNDLEGFLREDTLTGKLWSMSTTNKETLIMDIGKEAGDTFNFVISETDTIKLRITNAKLVDERKVLVTDFVLSEFFNYDTLMFIEGVGPNNGLFNLSYSFSESYLLCMLNNSEKIFQTSNEIDVDDCEYRWTDIRQNNVDEIAIKIYPNPTSNNIAFELNDNYTKGAKVCIYNLQGVKLLEETVFSKHSRLDITKYDSGIYIIRITIDGKQHISNIVVSNSN